MLQRTGDPRTQQQRRRTKSTDRRSSGKKKTVASSRVGARQFQGWSPSSSRLEPLGGGTRDQFLGQGRCPYLSMSLVRHALTPSFARGSRLTRHPTHGKKKTEADQTCLPRELERHAHGQPPTKKTRTDRAKRGSTDVLAELAVRDEERSATKRPSHGHPPRPSQGSGALRKCKRSVAMYFRTKRTRKNQSRSRVHNARKHTRATSRTPTHVKGTPGRTPPHSSGSDHSRRTSKPSNRNKSKTQGWGNPSTDWRTTTNPKVETESASMTNNTKDHVT